jgi:hypothetical protein
LICHLQEDFEILLHEFINFLFTLQFLACTSDFS